MNDFNTRQIVTVHAFMAAFAAMGAMVATVRRDEPSDEDANDGYSEHAYKGRGLRVVVTLWDDHNTPPEVVVTDESGEDVDLLTAVRKGGHVAHEATLWAAMRAALAADA